MRIVRLMRTLPPPRPQTSASPRVNDLLQKSCRSGPRVPRLPTTRRQPPRQFQVVHGEVSNPIEYFAI